MLCAGARASELPDVARILVPFPAGGGLDVIARHLADQLRGSLAKSVVVENRTGAAGRIAIDGLRQIPADGLTLMIHVEAIQSLYPYTFRQLSYDPFSDVAPISHVYRMETGFAVGPAAPNSVKTLKDYLAWARSDPRNASYATPGQGTGPHLLPLQLSRDAKIEMNPVHYRGSAAIWPDLLGGNIPAASLPVNELMPQLAGGKVRMLATSGGQRNKLTPEAGTYAAQGFPQLTGDEWVAVYVHGKTLPAVKERLSVTVRNALSQTALGPAFAKLYVEPSGSTPNETLESARAANARWAAILKSINYQPE